MKVRPIVIIGDVILDKTTTVKVRGISPEHDTVLVTQETGVSYNLGGAANVARNCKTLGADPLLLGFNTHPEVTRLLDKDDIPYDLTWVGNADTPIKNRIVTEAGHYIVRIDHEDKAFGLGADFWTDGGGIGRTVHVTLSNPGNDPEHVIPVFCLVDYNKGCLTRSAVKCLMWKFNQIHESFDFPIIVDPGRQGHWNHYGSRRTVFKVNLDQVMQHYRKSASWNGMHIPYPEEFDPNGLYDRQTYMDIADRVRLNLIADKTQFRTLLVTCGPGGIVAIDHDCREMVQHFHAVPYKNPDVCGAGDSVMAAIAEMYSRNPEPKFHDWSLVTAACYNGIRAGFAAVRNRGVYAVTREDMGWTTPALKTEAGQTAISG